jgi:paraquat-inducible protein B
MGKRPSPAVIGAFVLGAIALVVATIVILGAGRFFRDTTEALLFFEGSVNGLERGAPVKYRGVKIGQVTDIRIRVPAMPRDATEIPIRIEIDEDRLTDLGVNVKADEQGLVQGLVERGLRAKLQLQSLITGVLYIDLDLLPATPLTLVLRSDAYPPEIPTLPNTLEEAQAKVTDILDRLSRVDWESLGRDIGRTIKGATKLVNSPELHDAIRSAKVLLGEARDLVAELRPKIGPLADDLRHASGAAAVALRKLETAVTSLERIMSPDAPLIFGAQTALKDLSDASRAVRELADYLSRNPNAVITGRDR